MKLHRFYTVGPVQKGECIITDERLIHQWFHVLRFEEGTQLYLFDHEGHEFLVEIKTLNKKESKLIIIDEAPSRTSPYPIYACCALIKKDNFDLILQKCTEIGVSGIIPLITTRTERKELNMERAQLTVIEASEQCGRTILPSISTPIELSEFLKQKKEFQLIACDQSGVYFSTIDINKKKPIGYIVGPEGGWSDAERQLFVDHQIPMVSVGKYVLRAETAGVLMAGLLGERYG